MQYFRRNKCDCELLTFTFEWPCIGVLAPFLLLVSWAAFGTLDATSIVMTLASQYTRRTDRI